MRCSGRHRCSPSPGSWGPEGTCCPRWWPLGRRGGRSPAAACSGWEGRRSSGCSSPSPLQSHCTAGISLKHYKDLLCIHNTLTAWSVQGSWIWDKILDNWSQWVKCSRISSGLLIGLEMRAVMYQQQKNDSEAYMVWKERESSWTWFRRKGFGAGCAFYLRTLCWSTLALCRAAGPGHPPPSPRSWWSCSSSSSPDNLQCEMRWGFYCQENVAYQWSIFLMDYKSDTIWMSMMLNV